MCVCEWKECERANERRGNSKSRDSINSNKWNKRRIKKKKMLLRRRRQRSTVNKIIASSVGDEKKLNAELLLMMTKRNENKHVAGRELVGKIIILR